MPFFTIEEIAGAAERRTEKIWAAQPGRALVKLLQSIDYQTVWQFYLVVVGGAFEEGAEFARARRVAQLAQGFGFDLANAFAGDGE